MIASPNYVFGIYDGDDSDATGAPRARRARTRSRSSSRTTSTRSVSRHNGTDFTAAPTTGRSSRSGIPSGGPVHRRRGHQDGRGGGRCSAARPGVAYDPCYHKACDTIANINDRALAVNTGAITAAALVYARSRKLPGGDAVAVSAPVLPVLSGLGGGAAGLGSDHDHAVVSR